MPSESSQSPVEQAIALLSRHGVDFIVIGGQAEVLHGGTRVTFDIDICYRRTEDNLERLANALREINPTLRNAPEGLPFRIDAQSLALGSNFTFIAPFGDFDLLGDVEPLGGYEEIRKNAERYEVGPYHIDVIGLDDLIRVKQHLRRPKDQDSLFQLLAIKRIREETGHS